MDKEFSKKYCVNRSSSLNNFKINKMALQTAQSSLDYLNEEVLNLIQNNQINESNFMLFRLQKLMEKLRIRFGEDPENAIFRKLLRLSVKTMNFFVSNYILDNFIKSNLRPISDETPDLLFLTMYFIKDQAKEFYENLQNNTNNLNNLIRNRTTFNYLNPSSLNNPFNDRVIFNLEHHFNHQTGHTSKFCDFTSFSKLITKLIPHSNINQFYITYGTSLLALVVENISSSELNPTCKLTLKERLFQICYDKLIELDYLDVNVGFDQYFENRQLQVNQDQKGINQQNLNHPNDFQDNQINQEQSVQSYRRPILNLPRIKRISILQQCINDLKYDVAEKLVLKGARIDDLNIDDVVFVKSCEKFFKTLFCTGYRFLPANIFKLKYDQCIKDDACFDRFCEFLKKHQTKQLPLSCLSWNVLRRHLGPKSGLILEVLSEQMNLPDAFVKYAKFQSLEILFQKS